MGNSLVKGERKVALICVFLYVRREKNWTFEVNVYKIM